MTTNNKNAILDTTPHYRRLKGEKTVFGKPSKSPYGHSHLSYVYSDRLYQWDYEKHERAVQSANELGLTPKTCLWYEAYLSYYYNKPIIIEHIIAGVNQSNGYPYSVYGYLEENK